jgi:hypothetical protein
MNVYEISRLKRMYMKVALYVRDLLPPPSPYRTRLIKKTTQCMCVCLLHRTFWSPTTIIITTIFHRVVRSPGMNFASTAVVVRVLIARLNIITNTI